MIGYYLRVSEQELKEIVSDSSLLDDKIDSEQLDNLLDIDKSWEAIFYLLTGHPIAEEEETNPPLSWILFNENVVEGQDMGFGPACYLTIDQLRQLNKALESITKEVIRQKYNGKEMNEAGVYPEVWEEPESLDYVLDYFEQLKAFLKTAETNNMAVIMFIG